MQHVGRVHSLQSSKGLIDKVLAMVVGQGLCANNAMHVCLHELLDKIYLLELLIRDWFLNVHN